MARAAHICGICDLRHVTKPTVSWCSECDEGFCSGCVEHHSLAKATRHHKTIPMSEYQTLPPEVLQIPQSCTKHDEKFLLYCKDHETPCCGKCAMEVHKECNEVVNLDYIIKNAKTSTSFQEIEETLAEVMDNIKEIHNFYRGNITTLSENRKQIEKQIQEIRYKIDAHLNQIQKKLVDEIQEAEETEIKKVRQLVKKLEEKEVHLTKYQDTIANIKQHASDLQTFMSIKQIEKYLASEEELIRSCLDGDKVNARVITCSIEESTETLMKSVQGFGKIVVEIKPTEVALRGSKKKQAQMVVQKLQTKSIQNVTARLQQTIKTTSQNVRGCCFLPDGRFAFTCYDRNMLIVIKANGVKDFEMQLPGAVDVANRNIDDTVIVSSACGKSGLSIVDILNRKVTSFIPVDSQCFGLVVNKENVIFCTDSKLKILNLQTQYIDTITNAGLSIFSYVDTNGKYIYYTALLKSSLTCCDFKGVIKWTIKDSNVMEAPLGIFVHTDGFMYVLERNAVVRVSPRGKESNTIVSSKDGLNNAQVLHYDETRDMLLVSNMSKEAFLYKVDLK